MLILLKNLIWILGRLEVNFILLPSLFPLKLSYLGTSTITAASTLLLSHMICGFSASSTSDMCFLTRLFTHRSSSFTHLQYLMQGKLGLLHLLLGIQHLAFF